MDTIAQRTVNGLLRKNKTTTGGTVNTMSTKANVSPSHSTQRGPDLSTAVSERVSYTGDGPSQTLSEIIEENLEYGVSIPVLDYDYNEQLDFDSIWQEKLRKKYGIRNAID